jgi:hypothetical protein
VKSIINLFFSNLVCYQLQFHLISFQNNDELNFWHLHATNLTSNALDEFNALYYNDSLNWDEKLQGYRAWSAGKGENVKAAYELWEARLQKNINEALTTLYRSAEETLSAEAMVIYKQIARNNQHSFERLVWQYLNAPNSVTSITVKQELVMYYRGFEELWKRMIEN